MDRSRTELAPLSKDADGRPDDQCGPEQTRIPTRPLGGRTLQHVTRRKQFGAALSEQQIVRAYLAEMATELDAARLLVARAAHLRDQGERVSTEAAMAKMFATEAAQRIIDHAVQLHGGMGVVEGTAVERLYREIRPLRIYEGTTEIQKLIIAKGLLSRIG